ncbi:hypothetical protein FE783_31945 [Paenibacillus mesophilus]|uniref:hypothetical protein n=1 Tax=Paenibacillus mesophilus TaxID=2582849 RepID=UPI00110E78DB|nr:hypothetical protein [Paenibacillus mesophilus]TMV44612.1 hypothetical protein FE783_31945 [Paenibacillus mesophilus]
MNEIIDFLMRNLGLLIVVGGFVLTLLAKVRNAKGGSGNPQRGKPNPMMPPFGGGSRLEPKPRPQDSSRGGEERAGVRQAVDYGRREETSSVQEVRSTYSAGGAPAQEAAEERDNRDMEFTEQDALRGIMWAEIMGAPRSKKPYRPRNR